MVKIDNDIALSFDDVLIVPTESNVPSRLDVDMSITIGGIERKYPLISSPMDTVTEDEMAHAMTKHGCMSILHRFAKSNEEIIAMINRIAERNPTTLIVPSVGVGKSGEELYKMIRDIDDKMIIDGFCIDVANGHTNSVAKMIEYIRYDYPDITIIAGNVATKKGFEFLASAGANCVRTGIGSGSICITRRETGCGLPVFASILECADSKYRDSCAIIADGGIRYPADVAKAIGAGATAVICGSIFSGTDETPGEILQDSEGTKWKKYRGMASREIQDEKRGGMKEGTTSEGVSTYVKYKGPVKDVVDRFVGGLRSSMTYVNARTIKEFQQNVKFKRITQGGLVESHDHINNTSDKPVWGFDEK